MHSILQVHDVLLIHPNRRVRFFSHFIQCLVLLGCSFQLRFGLLELLINLGHSLVRIISTSLMQVKDALFLPELFQLALSFIQLRCHVPNRTSELLNDFLVRLDLIKRQLLHLLLSLLILHLLEDAFDLAIPSQLDKKHVVLLL